MQPLRPYMRHCSCQCGSRVSKCPCQRVCRVVAAWFVRLFCLYIINVYSPVNYTFLAKSCIFCLFFVEKYLVLHLLMHTLWHIRAQGGQNE